MEINTFGWKRKIWLNSEEELNMQSLPTNANENEWGWGKTVWFKNARWIAFPIIIKKKICYPLFLKYYLYGEKRNNKCIQKKY